MDPFSGAVSVLTVVGMALKMSQETHIMVQSIRSAPAQVQRLATELRDLYSLLAMFQSLLDRAPREPEGTVMDMLENLQKVLKNCMVVLKDTKTTLAPFVGPDGANSMGFWRGVQYAAFKRSDVVVLQEALSSYKTMLNMSYTALNV